MVRHMATLARVGTCRLWRALEVDRDAYVGCVLEHLYRR